MSRLFRGIEAVDLFCGAGGLTHGLTRSGIDVEVGIDLDPDCRFPFEHNNAAKFIEADVKDLSTMDILRNFKGDTLHMLAGCAPCQSFSTYSRASKSKKRHLDWQLVESFARLVTECRPHFVTMENVPQLAGHPVFKGLLNALKEYHVKWSVVDCAEFGVPQSRRRLVLLASRLGDEELALDSSRVRPQTVRDTISKLPPLKAGDRSPVDPLHVCCTLSATNLRRIRASVPGGTWRDWDPDLQAACHRRSTGATYPSVYGRMEWDKVSPTITTQCFGYGNGRFGHPEQDRALSLREAAMLQTFPESYEFVPSDAPVRFNRLGRLIGNAVPVRIGEVIGEAFVRHAEHYGALAVR